MTNDEEYEIDWSQFFPDEEYQEDLNDWADDEIALALTLAEIRRAISTLASN